MKSKLKNNDYINNNNDAGNNNDADNNNNAKYSRLNWNKRSSKKIIEINDARKNTNYKSEVKLHTISVSFSPVFQQPNDKWANYRDALKDNLNLVQIYSHQQIEEIAENDSVSFHATLCQAISITEWQKYSAENRKSQWYRELWYNT